jgi:hypothetical protein
MTDKEKELTEKIEKLNSLSLRFKPYDHNFNHREWLKEVNLIAEREEDSELCSDYFYDDEVLGQIIIGMEKELKAIREYRKVQDSYVKDILEKDVFFNKIDAEKLVLKIRELATVKQEAFENGITEGKKIRDKEFEGDLIRKDNHILGCMLECYENILRYRHLDKEADMLLEVASRIK